MGSSQLRLTNSQKKAQQGGDATDCVVSPAYTGKCSLLGCLSYGKIAINMLQKSFFLLQKKITPMKAWGHPAG